MMNSAEGDEFELAILKAFGEMLDQGGADLGLPPNFLYSIAGEDDWGFFIKLHALVEAAVDEALVSRMGQDKPPFQTDREALTKLIAKNNLDGRMGKIALLKVYGLCSEQTERSLRLLAEVRNAYAHRVTNISKRVEELEAGQKLIRSDPFNQIPSEIKAMPGAIKYFAALHYSSLTIEMLVTKKKSIGLLQHLLLHTKPARREK